MHQAYVIVTVLTVVANLAVAVVDLTGWAWVRGNASRVGVPSSWIPMLAGLKAAGALGLSAGLAGLWLLGVAAAAGLTLFFVAAVVAHLRARAFSGIAFPVGYLALAVASLGLGLAV